MRALDLCCGAGGASEGLSRAGFTVVGVDIKRQPSYRHTFMQVDACQALRQLNPKAFDLVHASPPCERYTRGAMQAGTTELHPDLINALRELLLEWGVPFVIENVELARPVLRDPIMLCGTMFGLGVFRHRWFEVNGFEVTPPPHPPHDGKIGDGRYVTVTGKPGGRSNADGWEGASTEQWREAMGINWMSSREIVKALPPAYTEFIARQFLHPQPQRSSMGVNAPHPNEAPDDEAAAFFGDPDPAPGAPGLVDNRTELERKEDSYQYALSHGEPISEELNAAHEQYQAQKTQAEQDAEFEAAAPEQSDAERAAEVSPDPNDNLRAIAERERADAESRVEAEAEQVAERQAEEPEAAAEPDPTPADDSETTTEPQVSDDAEVEGEAPAESTGAKKSGDLSREYIVFRKLGLNKRVLEGLLKRIEDGSQPDPLVAWVEVERLDARNVVGAVSGAYTKHQERLGNKVDLAAVSSRSFQVKHVEPKQVVSSNLSIT
jgi:hypothetical protein